MSEIREVLTESITEVKNGELPLDTAESIHKLARRHVMDHYADEKTARRMVDEQVMKDLDKAHKELMEL